MSYDFIKKPDQITETTATLSKTMLCVLYLYTVNHKNVTFYF